MEVTLEQKGNRELLGLVREISELVDIHYVRQKEPRGLGLAYNHTKEFFSYKEYKGKRCFYESG
ncbi:hypothetical protein SY88_10640 [Clostridiales bacterium PH28_bin88]|nr:hypothetical protein SY88_10640 [Clostridiales bacterium PH28_bin88]